MIIGLTGLYCAGKNSFACMLAEQAELITAKPVHVLDVDAYGHAALQEKTAQLVEAFGDSILGVDNSIDRKKLGAIVFTNPAELAKLEAIVHPAMKAAVMTEAREKERSGDAVIINAALLYKMGLAEHCNKVVFVHAPYVTRLFRARKRDKLSLFQIMKRFSSQKKLFAHIIEKNADIIKVSNNGSSQSLERKARLIAEDLFKWEE